MTKKFENAIHDLANRHQMSVSLLDTMFQKTISNRPRYQPESVKPDLAQKSMRQYADRNTLTQSRQKRT